MMALVCSMGSNNLDRDMPWPSSTVGQTSRLKGGVKSGPYLGCVAFGTKRLCVAGAHSAMDLL